ncbi:unnamed protein product, partial [Adineta steineri]
MIAKRKRKRQLEDENNNPDQIQQLSSSCSTPAINSTLSKFLYYNSALPKALRNRLKESECKYIVAGMHSYRSAENDGLLEVTQTCIDVGATVGRVKAQNICLVIGDTPITTDEGANITASLKDEIRCPCMAHRCSTTLECTWEQTNRLSFDFKRFIDAVAELRFCIARSDDLQ